MKLKLIAIFASCALATAVPARAQLPAKPLFAADDPIHIVIQAPVASLAHNRENKTAIAGTLTER